MGSKGIGFVLSKSEDQHSSGIGGMAVKVMTVNKQQTSYVLGREWRKLVPTDVLVSVE